MGFAALCNCALVGESPTVEPAMSITLGLAIVAEHERNMMGLRFKCHLFENAGGLVP